MDVETLARIQFGLTVAFHYIFPPISIGLALILVIMEGMFIKTKNPLYEQMARFWVKIFALVFGIGVATGIVMEFQFGTNWEVYSRYVGDVFGSALAAEGVFAFFLESGFLALLVFGWDRVKPSVHFLSTILVALGSTFSAVWIVVANSWQQTPAGHHIVGEGIYRRAEIVDFWAMVFNPSSMQRLSHVVVGAWMTGAFFVLSVAAFYLLKNRHVEFAKSSMRVALIVALVSSLLQPIVGDISAKGVAVNLPAKLAAMEGHFDSSKPMDLYLIGWVDATAGTVSGLGIPGMTSWLLSGDRTKPVTGLDQFKPEDRPPVNAVFQTYHLMVGIGFFLAALSLVAGFLWWRGKLWNARWVLSILVVAVLLPQIANQSGWLAAELGRQPWVVYNLLRTSDATSKAVTSGEIMTSIVLFTLVYALLFALFIYLLDRKIKLGPDGAGTTAGSGKELFA